MDRIAKLTIVATRPGQFKATSVTVEATRGRETCRQLRADGWMIATTFATFVTQEAQ
jgi:hypothetical protein